MTATTVAAPAVSQEATFAEKAEAPARQRQGFQDTDFSVILQEQFSTSVWPVASPDPANPLLPARTEARTATHAAEVCRKLSATQVNLLCCIADACDTSGRWSTDDPRFALVWGLGRSLGALRRRGLITTLGDTAQITPEGRLAADAAPSLDDLLLKDKRYTQIMRNAADTHNADDDGLYEALTLTTGVKACGTGDALLGQMCAFGMLARGGSGAMIRVDGHWKTTAHYRLTDQGRRFITDVLGISLPDPNPDPIADPIAIEEPPTEEEDTAPTPTVGMPWPDPTDAVWLAGEDDGGDDGNIPPASDDSNNDDNTAPQADGSNPAHWLVDTAAGQFGLTYEVWQGDYYRNGCIRVEYTDDCQWRINVSFHDGYRFQRREVYGLGNGKRLVARSFSYDELHDTLIQQRLGVA